MMEFYASKDVSVRHTAYYLFDYPKDLGKLEDYFEGSKEYKRPLDELKHYAKSKGCTKLYVRNGSKETVYSLQPPCKRDGN